MVQRGGELPAVAMYRKIVWENRTVLGQKSKLSISEGEKIKSVVAQCLAVSQSNAESSSRHFG